MRGSVVWLAIVALVVGVFFFIISGGRGASRSITLPASGSGANGAGAPDGTTDQNGDGGERTLEIVTLLPKDAIPAIYNPSFLTVEAANAQYRDEDLVLGVEIEGETRAYNIPYLSGHEIVNDRVGGRAIAVTW